MNNLEELKKAAMKATQGEWWQDVVETEGTYDVGDNCSEGFHSYAVYGPDNNSLLDMTNSTAAIIHTEEDGDYLMAWDETGRRNAEYIALANPAAILDLIAQLEAAQGNIKELESKVNHYVAAEYAHKHFDQTPDIIKRADSAELELVKVKAELSAANEKLSKPVVLPPRRIASSFVDEEFSNKDLAAIYNAARIEFSVKITNAGFTVEDE
ncbi:ead/Ea22-like family protein [Yersinia enterocolitica]